MNRRMGAIGCIVFLFFTVVSCGKMGPLKPRNPEPDRQGMHNVWQGVNNPGNFLRG